MKRAWFGKAVLLASAAALLAGCSGGVDEEYRTITVSGTVSMIVGPMPEGTLNFRLYNLWYLDGELRHALEEIEDFQSDASNFSHTFEYPVHKGSGFAIHAWLDADGDGVFCTPEIHTDPAGFASMEETPDGDITMDITLTENCRAANFFYPPAAEKPEAEIALQEPDAAEAAPNEEETVDTGMTEPEIAEPDLAE